MKALIIRQTYEALKNGYVSIVIWSNKPVKVGTFLRGVKHP